jgi:hypothetical protein
MQCVESAIQPKCIGIDPFLKKNKNSMDKAK